MCLDVVLGGELYIVYKLNFFMEKVFFYGNNKIKEEINMGLDLGVGKFVVDNFYELDLFEVLCEDKGKI